MMLSACCPCLDWTRVTIDSDYSDFSLGNNHRLYIAQAEDGKSGRKVHLGTGEIVSNILYAGLRPYVHNTEQIFIAQSAQDSAAC